MAQYDQLLLFYNQLLNIADEINELIDKELFDDIINKVQLHDKLMLQIRLAKKCSNLTSIEQEEITKIENELKEKEKNNIEHLQINIQKVKSELDKMKFKSKIQRAYGQETAQEHGSIIDIDDSYKPI